MPKAEVERYCDSDGNPMKGDNVVVQERNAAGRITQLMRHDSRMREVLTTFTYHPDYPALPVSETVTVDGKVARSTGYGYKYILLGGRSILLPCSIRKGLIDKKGALSGYYDVLTIHDYDRHGNPVTVCDANGHETRYEWGYGGLHPTQRSIVLSDKTTLDTKWTWRPLVGMTSETTPDGVVNEYALDQYGRLSAVSSGGDIIAQYAYGIASMDVSSGDQISVCGQNWIREELPSGTGRSSIDVTYYDGLGLPEQKVMLGASGNGKDLVTLYMNDLYWRTIREYLPYDCGMTGGGYIHRAITAQRQWYAGLYGQADATLAYNTISYEYLADGRQTGSSLAGVALSEHPLSVRYISNKADDIPIIEPNHEDGSLRLLGFYGERKLFGRETTDGNGSKTTEWKDSYGNVVCTIGGDGGRTLYGYDFRGNLCWIVQPEGYSKLTGEEESIAENSRFAWQYCFRYLYDERGFCTMKWIPGSMPEYFTYDAKGNVLLEQNGVMKEEHQWRQYTYDYADRLTKEELLTDKDGGVSCSPLLLRQCIYDTTTVWNGLKFKEVPGMVTIADLGASFIGRLVREDILTTEGGMGIVRAYYYDKHGRVVQSVESLTDNSILRTSMLYDLQGRILNSVAEHDDQNGIVNTLIHDYAYDPRGKILHESATLNGKKALVSYKYDALGRVSRKLYGTDETEHIVAVSLTYNMQGWETGRIVTISDNNEAYRSRLTYYDTTKDAVPNYIGNISSWSWTRDGSSETSYHYLYDENNRVHAAEEYENGVHNLQNTERCIEYDKNGNILAMTRILGGESKHLTFTYDGNHRSGNDYMYDLGGNIEADLESTTMAQYNFLNLPKILLGGQGRELVNNYYLSDGTKVKSDMTRSHKGYYYVGPFRYKRDEDGAYSLDKVRFGGGEIIADSTGRLGVAFIITDHLESVRLKVNEDGEIIGSYDYLPYGMLASTSSGLGKDNETLFSGKEYQNALDVAWYDSGARYQTVQGIFTSPDPLAEKYPSISPYAYCAGNPINLVDPDGKRTHVKQIGNGVYEVVGGVLDNDLNVYVTYTDSNGKLITCESIGKTISPYSFYNTDGKDPQDRNWAYGSKIDLNDNSGVNFLDYFENKGRPVLIEYMVNARNGHKYDFKATNGMSHLPFPPLDIYRGLSIGTDNGNKIIASARDIGNIAAGYVAGANGLVWNLSKDAFDGYQYYTDIKSDWKGFGYSLPTFKREGLSTQVPEKYGWEKGYNYYLTFNRIFWYENF